MSDIDNDLDKILMICCVIFGEKKVHQKIKFQYIRVDWEYHVNMLEYTNEFNQRFCMSQIMFDDLVEELCIPLTVSVVHSPSSTSRNKPSYPEVIFGIGLWILGPPDTIES
jgi:hypothetical protein